MEHFQFDTPETVSRSASGAPSTLQTTQKKQPMIKQVSTIPFRLCPTGREYCLITSHRNGRWGFPKGTVERGETAVEAALRETVEEAGLGGQLLLPSFDWYTYSRSKRQMCVEVMLLEVTSVDSNWPEQKLRQRRWMSVDEARDVLCRKRLLRLLEHAESHLEMTSLTAG